MKHLKFFLLVLVSSLTSFYSCSEEELQELPVVRNEGNISLFSLGPSINGKGGTEYTGEFLSFESIQDFENTYYQLEAELDANDFYIRNMIGTVTSDEEIDAKFVQYNLDEFKPLKDFENLYGLNSLRNEIFNQENAWLATQGDDFDEDDPDNHYIFDIILRTMLNKDAEVMIAGTIYRFDNWATIEIFNMDPEAYYRAYPCDGDDPISPNTGIDPFNRANPCDWQSESGGGGGSNSCRASVSHTREYKISSNRKMKTQVKLQREFPIFRNNRFIARTRYFKKVLGVWLRKNADLYVKMEGTHQLTGCVNGVYILEERNKYGGQAEVKYVNPSQFDEFAIKKQSLFSTHKLWGGNTKTMDFYDGN